MEQPEFDKLLQDIQELKQSVRKANPFLRDIFGIKDYAIMSFPLGLILLADCIAAHMLSLRWGSLGSAPRPWPAIVLGSFALFVVAGGTAKWITVIRKARQAKRNATFITVLDAMFGGFWFGFSVPVFLCTVACSVFVAWSGHPWLILSVLAIFMGPYCIAISKLLDREEYGYTGWYLVVAGLASLFFAEAAPYVWMAIVWAGTFFVFGAAGLRAFRPARGDGA
jgi:hypothetical protein